MKKYILFSLFSFVFWVTNAQKNGIAPQDLNGIRAIGSPANPKVKMTWDQYHDYAQVTQLGRDLVKAYPNLVKMESVGKSYEGRDLWVLTISDFDSDKVENKPGFYIDGGIHANEMQGVEVAMYTAWYLAESFQTIKFINTLLKEKVFYIVMTISPDGRENFIYKPNNSNTSRSGMRPFDNDGDGLVNEDTLDDLDNDGNIVMMRRKSKIGRWKTDPKYPTRMYQVKGDEIGDYEMLGYEGLDNDKDGLVNEDLIGTYDPNRDWGWNWQPNYVQNGALFYPGTLPETRAIKAFIINHPNIAGAQSYHNYGGMFLRGPGAAEDDALFAPQDIEVYDNIGKLGEKMIPGYNYFVIHKDLYTVYGGEIDFLSLTRGIFTFSNELMTSYKLFNQKNTAGRWDNDEFNEFDKYLLFGDGYVEWKEFNHPQFGDIEIGGPKKNYIRNHPGFMIQEDAHRNMAFSLYHAYQTPKLEIVGIETEKLSGDLVAVTATIMNTRIIPTHSRHDVKNKIERPNYISLAGSTVVAGMTVQNEDLNLFTEQKFSPETIAVPIIEGMGNVKVRWIVKGNPSGATVNVSSAKGGTVSEKVK
ncbi:MULTISPECIES: M14 family metallopeptidase [unclassified Flavobacterium]|uniref:M14 family metallopeptidase n=1 Tax=unclassified Flavobacterium TaxID=196869 RepID=UPI000F83F711|nr:MULTISPECIES: M14 family metallopeptidase [unclassified Flavobacterium]RTY68984.1 peptidase M14 [Flavobacterium sp. LB2P53]RTY74349.1 peptidase M14 [Flavobacterium sp. LS1R10]